MTTVTMDQVERVAGRIYDEIEPDFWSDQSDEYRTGYVGIVAGALRSAGIEVRE